MPMEISYVTVVVVIVLLSVSFLPPSISGYSLLEIKPWCSKVPYPNLCEHFFTNRPNDVTNIPIHQKSDFFNVSVQLVLERAVNASKTAQKLGSSCCHDRREKTAWGDCVDLYKNTISILNQTNDPDTKFSPYDVQTWLGTTLTNLETCEQGFIDFGITNNIMPLVSDIVLRNLTVNALALNSDSCNYLDGSNNTSAAHENAGFPNWVSPAERKLLQSSPTSDPSNWTQIVVAQDGSGQFTNVTDAVLEASKKCGRERVVIYVKAGEYIEGQIFIRENNIMMIGDGIGVTIISGDLTADEGRTISTAATVIVEGGKFIARGITFRNNAGPDAGRAIALRSDSDYSIYYLCGFEGYQDTLYVRTNTQFFRECNIYGTVDFIMGDATVEFQGCTILPRSHYPNMVNAITAQSKSSPYTCSGMAFHKCHVTSAPDLKPIEKMVKTYLGRPWKDYSRVVFLDCYLDRLVDPEGWLSWEADPKHTVYTVYYGEYNNKGPGALTDNRVKWPGYHVIRDDSEALNFSVRRFIRGESWLPDTSIPYDLDL